MEELEEYLKAILDDTLLLDKSKEVLLDEAMEIYEVIEHSPRHKKDEANVALSLACDKYSCAIPKKIPRLKLKLLAKTRKKTGIERVDVIERIDSMCRLADFEGDCVPKKAKHILEIYQEGFPLEYQRGRPIGTAAGAIYIAAKLCDEYVTQRYLQGCFGVTETTIRDRYKNIADNLNIELKI